MCLQDSDSDPLEPLIDEFLERRRRGERPSLAEFAQSHPEHGERLRSLIPAMLAMEEFGLEHALGSRLPRFDSLAALPRRLGDYLLLRPVGSGGMGVVYEAIQESMGRRVALKTIPSHQPDDATRRERFRREAHAAARLRHPHIVPVYEIGEYDCIHFYTMRFIDGSGLDLILREVERSRRESSDRGVDAAPGGQDLSTGLAWKLRHGHFLAEPPPAVEAGDEAGPRLERARAARTRASHQPRELYFRGVAWLGARVAEALDYAHRQGVLHRDIKPSNLLLDVDGRVWVTDFGLAKTQDGDVLTRTGDVVGTLRYMAPERFRGWSDPRSDVFALGATLYELLTTRPAFDEPDRARLIDRLLHGAPTPPRRHDRRFPRDLETILLKALANAPSERYATAGQLAEDLVRFVAGRPILARGSSVIEKAWRWTRRNPAAAGAAIVVTAALTLTVATSLNYAYQQARAARHVQALATALGRERESLRISLLESRRTLSMHDFERGQAAFEKEQVAQGLLWMMSSWRSAGAAGDPKRCQAARANASAWLPRLPRLIALLSHDGPVDAAVFSPDGATILTGGDDAVARLWDADSARPKGPVMHHPGAVQCVAFSPDGATALTGCVDGVARFWNVADGRPTGPLLKHDRAILSVAFSPNGRIVLTGGGDRTAQLWSVSTGLPIGGGFASQGEITSVVFDSSGDVILTTSRDCTARLWSVHDGKPIGQPMRNPGEVLSAAFSPDGRTLITGCWGGGARVWDTATGLPISGELKLHRGHVRSIAFCPDGSSYATGSEDKSARLWHAETNKPLGPAWVHQGPVSAVAFSPDGRSMMTASSDRTVRVWSQESRRYPEPELMCPRSGRAVAFRSDGRAFFSARDVGPVRQWDVATGRQLGEGMSAHARSISIACSRDGKHLLVGGSPASLWDASTTQPVGREFSHPGGADVVAFHPSGRIIATGGVDRTTRLWDVSNGELIGSPVRHPGTIDALAFGPDGNTIVTGLDVGIAQVWNLGTWEPQGPALRHPGAVSSIAYSPDGKTLATACEDGMARLWNAVTGELLAPPSAHQAWVFAVAFSPDGKSLLTGSRDCSARLWDSASGQAIGPPFPHSNQVWNVSFAPDGKSILTADNGGVARIFAITRDLPDDPELVGDLIEVLTGLRLDPPRGSLLTLDNTTWRAKRDRVSRSPGRLVETEP